MSDLRCENGIKFGELNGDVLEVKCRSNRCGAAPGVLVLHRFNLKTGERATKVYADAAYKREEVKS